MVGTFNPGNGKQMILQEKIEQQQHHQKQHKQTMAATHANSFLMNGTHQHDGTANAFDEEQEYIRLMKKIRWKT